jgi:hypothetical protein
MKYTIFLTMALFSFGVMANPCQQDQKQFCSSIEPGKGQIAKCLSDYEGQLSAACKTELKEFKAKSKKRNPCFEDLVEYCADVPSDKFKIEVCLLKHENRLSTTCATDFKSKKGKILTSNICAQDVANNCYAELKSDEGMVTRCLIKNQEKLSKFCKDKVQKQVKKMKDANPCFDDTEKLCQGMTKFTDIHPCLVKNRVKLSAQCGARVDKEQKKIAASPCYMDLKQHCVSNINPEEQDRCLEVNKEHLSNKCSQFREVRKNKAEKMVTACEADRLKFCSKEPFEGGKITKCLLKVKAQLSAECKKLI